MTVSVIIAAYNVEDILGRAIRSALNQTAQPLEILVVDDCSTDGTAEVVKQIRHPLIRLVSTPANGGPAVARNVGLSIARGEWVAVLDADDAWKPDRLRRLTAVGDAEGADFVADNLVLWDINADKEIRVAMAASEPLRRICILDLFENDLVDFNFEAFSWSLLKPLMRRSFLANHGIRYDEAKREGEDFRLYADVLFHGAKAFLFAEPYYVYSAPWGPGGRSPHTRSVHNFWPQIETSDALRERYKDQIDEQLAEAIAHRRAVIELIHQANVARAYRRSRHYGEYIRYVGAKPQLIRSLFLRSLRRVQRRLEASIADRPRAVQETAPQRHRRRLWGAL
jgi:succinoglycan biosynthesis protein ExoO